VLHPIAELLCATDRSETLAACLDVAQRFGALVSLSAVRRDGWLDRIGRDAENFSLVSQIVGRRQLAYAILLGVRITSLARDPVTPANTSVHFTVEDGQEQVLPLAQFRSQVTASLLGIPRHPRPVTSLPAEERDGAELLGDFFLLTAPLFDISLSRLVLFPADEGFSAVVGFTDAMGHSFMPIDDFRQMITDSIAEDLKAVQPVRHRLDLSLVETAQQATADGDFDRVISLLETWPGLLSTMLRTPEVQSLKTHQLVWIAAGLKLLGDAFDAKGDKRWSEELYRLGLQYIRDLEEGAPLYLTMGLLMNREDRSGEAIGYLRRALALGTPPVEIYPALGIALLKTGKTIGAYFILKEARRLGGVPSDAVQEALECAADRIRAAQLSWPPPDLSGAGTGEPTEGRGQQP